MNNDDTIIFRVDETSDLPIWAQLRNRMAYLIRTGFFEPGEQLPSVRALAADARINYNTVTKAYRDLELEGLIISIRGRGMFVRKDIKTDQTDTEGTDALLESCIDQYHSSGMTYQDIQDHILSAIEQIEQKAEKTEKERRSYES